MEKYKQSVTLELNKISELIPQDTNKAFEEAWKKSFTKYTDIKDIQDMSAFSPEVKNMERAAKDVISGYNDWSSILFLPELYNLNLLGEDISGSVVFKILLSIYQTYALQKHIYVSHLPINKQEANKMLEMAEVAYHGGAISQGYRKLDCDEVPNEVRDIYNSEKGWLDDKNGLIVWLGKSEFDEVVISYSGTIITSDAMLEADVAQAILGSSSLYYRAVGLLRIFLEKYKKEKFLVTGHSLGGGLASFAVAANIVGNEQRIRGYSFNQAGLSKFTFDFIGDERLKLAKDRFYAFSNIEDWVSSFGGVFGTRVILTGDNEESAHSLNALKKNMKRYVDDKDTCEFGHVMSSNVLYAENRTLLEVGQKVSVNNTTKLKNIIKYEDGHINNISLIKNTSIFQAGPYWDYRIIVYGCAPSNGSVYLYFIDEENDVYELWIYRHKETEHNLDYNSYGERIKGIVWSTSRLKDEEVLSMLENAKANLGGYDDKKA